MQWLNPIALSITIRIMDLLLAAVAVQFMIKGILAVRADGWIRPPRRKKRADHPVLLAINP